MTLFKQWTLKLQQSRPIAGSTSGDIFPLLYILIHSFSLFLFRVYCCCSFLSKHKGPCLYLQQQPVGWREREGGKENTYKLFLSKWWGQSSCVRKVTEVAVWAGLCFYTKLPPNKCLFIQYSTSETGQQAERTGGSDLWRLDNDAPLETIKHPAQDSLD